MSDNVLRVVEEQSIDNTHGVTQRVIQENTINNMRGVTQRVYVVGGGGGGGNIDELNVTPSTTAQTITASGGTDGYSPVNVAAVTSAIDANIVAGNIKKDVSILGVTGTYEGATPTGTITITSNGTHDVTNYATADVNVPTTAPALYREFELTANGTLQPNTTTTHIMDFTGVKDISIYGLYAAYQFNTAITGTVNMSDLTTLSNGNACEGAFFQCTGLTGINLSSLTTINGTQACREMFMNCSGLTSINLSSLTTISGSQACLRMFFNCHGLTSIDLSSLLEITNTNGAGNMFTNCTYLVSANLSSLTRVLNQGMSSMFYGCSRLTNVDLSSLSTLGANALTACFTSCTGLTSLSFPCLSSFSSNSFTNVCANITSITLHFPSNQQAGIESATGYSTTAPFGATSGTVLFDLPATYTLTGADSNTYSRNPKYDTATSLAWKVGAYGTTNFTPAYYTSGTTDPSVSDAIYSDAACTQSVTTITAIA